MVATIEVWSRYRVEALASLIPDQHHVAAACRQTHSAGSSARVAPSRGFERRKAENGATTANIMAAQETLGSAGFPSAATWLILQATTRRLLLLSPGWE